jgi:hypothetical protein
METGTGLTHDAAEQLHGYQSASEIYRLSDRRGWRN